MFALHGAYPGSTPHMGPHALPGVVPKLLYQLRPKNKEIKTKLNPRSRKSGETQGQRGVRKTQLNISALKTEEWNQDPRNECR